MVLMVLLHRLEGLLKVKKSSKVLKLKLKMNTTMALLFHLDISLDHLAKLRAYYYIPENKVHRLKPGGFLYVVERRGSCLPPLRYLGILVAATATELTVCGGFNDKVPHATVHVFYRPPQSAKTKHIMSLVETCLKN